MSLGMGALTRSCSIHAFIRIGVSTGSAPSSWRSRPTPPRLPAAPCSTSTSAMSWRRSTSRPAASSRRSLALSVWSSLFHLHHRAVLERHTPVHAGGDVHVVGGDDHGKAGGAHELGERIEHVVGG